MVNKGLLSTVLSGVLIGVCGFSLAPNIANAKPAKGEKTLDYHKIKAETVVAKPQATAVKPASLKDYVQIPPNELMVVDTTKGRIIVALAPKIAPTHVKRITELTREKFYNGIVFHRVIDGFMDQTGDPTGTGTGGSSKPDIKGEFEFRRSGEMPFVKGKDDGANQFGWIGLMPITTQQDAVMDVTSDGKAKAWINHCPGITSMARSEDPNSANSQFFFMRDKSSQLDRKYSAWGYVVSGLEVVKSIKLVNPEKSPPNAPGLDKMLKVTMMDDLPAKDQVKVFYAQSGTETFNKGLAAAMDKKGAIFGVCDFAPDIQIITN